MASRVVQIELATDAGPALAELHGTGVRRLGLLVLTHGAGGGVHAPDLDAVGDAAVAAGLVVALLTQPFRVAGRRAPTAPAAQDAAWLQALVALRRRRGLARLPLVLGGRSNGARVASRTARHCGAHAVVALAFPLHPPGRPQLSRLPELDAAGVQVLVVQGERDPFGMPPDGPLRQVVVVPGADHALRRDLGATSSAAVQFVTSVCLRARVGP